MDKKFVNPGTPFSDAVRFGNLLFISGQGPNLHDEVPTSISEQTRNCLEKIEKIIMKEDGNAENILKMTVFCTSEVSINDFRAEYTQFFHDHHIYNFPAASAVVVSKLLYPSWKIEIDAIAGL
ncbi:RutC family protein [Candidatus Lokiarchaeum ossiferum]|uniref:RutC family protein n=1 Tax=Candidatus Lokiarchaeum ossiferum TaxID=2951803 RepID=A0ABY6HJU1_9ARCH|nr:RutC family protein [Candidatus Lokiarchaeum sp. B-35]